MVGLVDPNVRFVLIQRQIHSHFVVGVRVGDGRLCSANRYRNKGPK